MRTIKTLFILALAFSLHSCGSGILTSPREDPNYNNHQDVGSSAHDYLSNSSFHKAIIEIQAVSGFEPTAQTLNNLRTFITARLNKASGVEIISDPVIPSPGKSSYSLDDVRKIENDKRLYFTTGTTIYAYFLFLDGASSQDTGNQKVLGYAHQNTSIVIFEKTIQSLSGDLLQPSTTVLESTVMEHEFGHLMGLVNIGSPMQTPHQDSAHGAHCTDTSCLMYYNTDTSDIVANLVGNNIPQLDANCLADLHANGGQ